MLLCEVLERLNNDGISARSWHVRHLLAAGDVARPPQDRAGRFLFADEHVLAVKRRLLERPVRKQGLAPRRSQTPQ